MADISGENLVPQGRAGTGAAYVLGANVPSALSVLVNGQRQAALAAQRAALARQKEAEMIGKRYDEDKKINYDAGGAFQPSFNDYVAPLAGQLVDKYTQFRAGTLSRPQLDRDVANMKGEAERERLLSIDRDKNMSAFQDSELATGYRDRANLRTAFGDTLLTDNGTGGHKRIQAGQYNELTAKQQINDNPLTYVPDKIIEDQIKRRATSTVAEAYSNGVGGQHGASTFTSNGFVVQAGKDGALQPAKASNGLPVMDYSDVDLQRDRSGDHKFDMAIKRLQLGYKQEQAATPGARDKTDLELYKEAARSYVHFKETQSVGQNAQPRQPRLASGGKPKGYDIVDDNNEFGDYVLPANVATGEDKSRVSSMIRGAKTYEASHETLGGGKKPMRVDGKEVSTTGTRFKTVYRPNEKGDFVVDQNNNKPVAGNYQEHFTDAVDANGLMINGKTKAEKLQMIREGKATTGRFVAITSIGNKDYTASSAENYKQLKEANDKEFGDRKKADAVLLDQAKRMALRGSEVVVIPYDSQDGRLIDSDTKGYYKAGQQRSLQMRQQLQQAPSALPAQTPKEATGGAYQRKAAPATPNQPKRTKPTTGGAY